MVAGVRAWTRRVRADVAYLVVGLPWQLTGPPAALTLALVTPWTRAEWRRLLHYRPDAGSPAGAVTSSRTLRTAAGWRRLGYHLAVAPLVAAGSLALGAASVVGLALLSMPVWMWATTGVARLSVITAGYLALGGALLLLLSVWLAGVLARADAAVTRALLGRSRSGELAERVAELTDNRRALLDAVDAERRRIERDLHDGAQQRLVALSVNLGLAEVTSTGPVRQVLADARRQAEAAIADLTGLVRGLHPPILEDRGLAAALSSLAADLPLPVTVSVPDVGRPAPSVESVAYFVVAEALTNAVKHATASRATVGVTRAAETLTVRITDDGRGGADAARGTGLAGLARRVASVDGRLSVTSPDGGPTTIEARLPCVP